MITGQETSKIYISGLLQNYFPQVYEDLVHLSKKHHLKFEELPKTRDIWVRDFMPVQVRNDKFIEYRYDPDYLQTKKWRKDKSYPDIICEKIGLNTTKTDIILDGGNVIRGKNHAILTDKAILENKDYYNEDQLINELRRLFEVEHIVWIPWDKENKIYGHADGMVRFIDDHNVLVNHYFREYNNKFQDQLFGSLEKAGLNYHELKIDVAKPDDRNSAYINYLRTKDIIILPALDIEEDQLILDQIKHLFPN
jgi:agmatine deiminase